MTDIVKAANKLIECVEFDMNGAGGKGGNGGLLSDTTLRAAHDLRVIMSREAETPKVYHIGVNTMAQVFKPSGLTDLHDLQAVFDAIENAISAQVRDVAGLKRLEQRTFAIQHNPNCPAPWLVRLPGKSGRIDMKSHADQLGFVKHVTGDFLGFGKTLDEAADRALAAAAPAKQGEAE